MSAKQSPKPPGNQPTDDRLSQRQQINLQAAGIDIGARTHWGCMPADRDSKYVRSFGCFSADLSALADWLMQCGIEAVAMESTGVYWIPRF